MDRSRRDGAVAGRRVALVALPVATAVVLAAGLSPAGATGVAADGIAQFVFEPSSVTVEPGETFTVDLVLRSTPAFASGAFRVGVVVAFDGSVLDATGVERGPFMRLHGGNTTVETNVSRIDNERGLVVYELERDPPGDGTYGSATFAELTFRVEADAPNGTSRLAVRDARVLLVDGMFQRVITENATVAVVDPPATDPATATPRSGTGSRTDGVTATPPPATDPATATPAAVSGAGRLGLLVLVAGAIGLVAGMLLLVRRVTRGGR